MTEGGEKGKSEGGEGENQGGKLPHPVQMLVVISSSISTITSPASSRIIISVIFTRTKEPVAAVSKELRKNTFRCCLKVNNKLDVKHGDHKR